MPLQVGEVATQAYQEEDGRRDRLHVSNRDVGHRAQVLQREEDNVVDKHIDEGEHGVDSPFCPRVAARVAPHVKEFTRTAFQHSPADGHHELDKLGEERHYCIVERIRVTVVVNNRQGGRDAEDLRKRCSTQ